MRRLRADCSARRRFNAPRVRRALGGALTAFLVAVWQFVAVPAPAPVALTAASVLGAAALLTPDGAEARSRTSSASRSSSSGGYSRSSSSSSSSRTPSYSSSSRSSSASDKAISRANSAKALDSYRRSQEPPAAAAPSRASQSTSSGGGKPGKSSASKTDWPDWLGDRPTTVKPPRRPSADVNAPFQRYDPRWSPPAYARTGPRSFGVWDAAMLWFLLDTFNRPGHAAFFHDNGQDPGLQQWRAEAERMAQGDPTLQTRLASLDKATAKLTDSPPQPGRLPESVADKFEPVVDDGDDGGVVETIIGVIVLVLVIGLIFYAVVRIIRLARRLLGRGDAKTPPSGAKSQQGDAALFNLFGGKDKARAAFRVGMTVTIDPTPFLLAGDAIKAQQPSASPGGLANAQGIGTLNSDALTLHRIYLSDADFLQIHLDDDGKADECRLFHVIDEVDPPDEKAWKEWLDKREGMIGWRDFKTPDGKTYERVWSPGAKRVAPVKFHESEDSAKGLTLSKYECMLYRADTGLEAPAPTVEYLLVSVVERDGQAWVEIAAGIDVNPASLSLT